MERKGQNATEKRLAQVRALKGRYFEDELSHEEQLQAKDAQIALLENEIIELQRKLDRAKKRQSRPRPERPQRGETQQTPEPTQPATDDEPRFNFYRD